MESDDPRKEPEVDTLFAMRMKRACDANPLIPDENSGRLSSVCVTGSHESRIGVCLCLDVRLLWGDYFKSDLRLEENMADIAEDEDLRMLRIERVLDLFPVSRVTLYRLIRSGDFPEPTKMGRTSLWRSSDLRRWTERQKGAPVPGVKPRRGADLI